MIYYNVLVCLRQKKINSQILRTGRKNVITKIRLISCSSSINVSSEEGISLKKICFVQMFILIKLTFLSLQSLLFHPCIILTFHVLNFSMYIFFKFLSKIQKRKEKKKWIVALESKVNKNQNVSVCFCSNQFINKVPKAGTYVKHRGQDKESFGLTS